MSVVPDILVNSQIELILLLDCSSEFTLVSLKLCRWLEYLGGFPSTLALHVWSVMTL